MRTRLSLIFFLLLVTALPGAVRAASLSVTPDAATVHVGDTIGVTVYLDANGGSINASDGELSYASDLLSAQSVAYGNSIFSMWAQEPAINNSSGSVTWSGGSSSVFSGSHGRVLRVVFVAKKPGISALTLPSSSIYADDGLGTNVGTTPTPSSLTIVATAVAPTTPVTNPTGATAPASAGGDEKLTVTSPTHPSQTGWYANTTAVLQWALPPGVIAVRTILATREGVAPTIPYKPAIAQKTVDKLSDGVQYFMIRGQYADGLGPITSYRLQVDTTPPVLTASSVFYDATSTTLSVYASASDATAGIRNFALLIDAATSTTFTQTDVANGSYRISRVLTEGNHTVIIRAIDAAGNSTDSNPFTILVPSAVGPTSGWLAWLSIFSWRDWLLFLLILIMLLSLGLNGVLWLRLRLHERRFVRGLDMRKIRTLTVAQLTGFKKEVASEIRVLERAHQRRDITMEQDDEIKKMHHHLAELETFIDRQIDSLSEE